MTFDSPVWLTPTGHEMRAVLARLELVSAGTTASWGSSGGESDHGPQSGDSNPEFMTFRSRFENATDDGKRTRIIAEAREALENLTGRATREQRAAVQTESADDLYKRIREDGRGYSLADAAVRFRCPSTWVVRAREKEPKLDTATGDPLTGVADLPSAEQMAEVVRMADAGMTERQIESCTGLSKSTVRRRLGRAA